MCVEKRHFFSKERSFKCPPLAAGKIKHDKNKIQATNFSLQHASKLMAMWWTHFVCGSAQNRWFLGFKNAEETSGFYHRLNKIQEIQTDAHQQKKKKQPIEPELLKIACMKLNTTAGIFLTRKQCYNMIKSSKKSIVHDMSSLKKSSQQKAHKIHVMTNFLL